MESRAFQIIASAVERLSSKVGIKILLVRKADLIGGVHKEMKSQYCDIVQAGNEILKAIGNESTWSAFEHEKQDFKRGAMWGMAWAMNHIYAYTPKFTKVERYPCDHCGSCPVWLAAFEGEEINTVNKLLKACIEQRCELVGEIVDHQKR